MPGSSESADSAPNVCLLPVCPHFPTCCFKEENEAMKCAQETYKHPCIESQNLGAIQKPFLINARVKVGMDASAGKRPTGGGWVSHEPGLRLSTTQPSCPLHSWVLRAKGTAAPAAGSACVLEPSSDSWTPRGSLPSHRHPQRRRLPHQPARLPLYRAPAQPTLTCVSRSLSERLPG